MTGVVVLNTAQAVSGTWSTICAFIISGLVILGVVVAVILSDKGHGFAAFFMVVMFIGCISFVFRNIPTYTQYEVTLTDEASWYEFTQKYEVLSVKGSILTIKDK